MIRRGTDQAKVYSAQGIEQARSAVPEAVLTGTPVMNAEPVPINQPVAVVDQTAASSFDSRVRPVPADVMNELDEGQTYLLGQYAANASDDGVLTIRLRNASDKGVKVGWFTYSLGREEENQLVIMGTIRSAPPSATDDSGVIALVSAPVSSSNAGSDDQSTPPSTE